jgi:hypothetical protein
MAKRHSTRLKAQSSSGRDVRARVATSRARGVGSRGLAGGSSLKSRAARVRGVTHPWVVQLQQVALALGGAYSSCVTAQLALRAQDAEQDREIMRTLMMHVAGPVSRQVETLEAVVTGLTGAVDATGVK